MDVHVELSEKEQADFITEWDRLKTPKDHLQSNLLIAMVYPGVDLILLDHFLWYGFSLDQVNGTEALKSLMSVYEPVGCRSR